MYEIIKMYFFLHKNIFRACIYFSTNHDLGTVNNENSQLSIFVAMYNFMYPSYKYYNLILLIVFLYVNIFYAKTFFLIKQNFS